MRLEEAEMKEMPNYTLENERYLLNIIKKQLGITNEDMKSPGLVKAKVREAKIEEVLSTQHN
jgi:hypothetical protein